MTKSVVKVSKSGHNLEQWTAMQSTLKEFAFMIRKDLVVSNPHGRSVEAKDEDGKFHIIFYSAPQSGLQVVNWRQPGVVFDIDLSVGQTAGLALVQLPGGKLVLDNNGTVAGMIMKQSLFICFDLPHGGNATWTARLLKRILDCALPIILTTDQIKDRAEAWRKEKFSSSRNDYAKICLGRQGKQIEKIKKDLRAAEARRDLIQQQYIDHMRHVTELARIYTLHQKSDTKLSKKKLLNEYDKMLKFPGVESVFVNDKEIVVDTKPLNTQKLRDGSVRSLGQYRITLGVDDGLVGIMNLVPNGMGRPHPHVDPYGRPCFGNIGESIIKLVSSYEFAAVVDIMLKYIQTINEADTNGATVYRWPKLAEQKKAAQK